MLSQRRKEQTGPIYSKWGKRQGEVKKKKKKAQGTYDFQNNTGRGDKQGKTEK